MKPLRLMWVLAAMLLWGAVGRADDVITNVMSPVASYQYPNDIGSEAVTNGGLVSPFASYQYPSDLGSEGLTNGGLMSPIASYQYFEWPGNDVLQLNSSPLASYYYQYLNALSLLVVPTDRLPKTAETTPAIAYPYPTLLQLKRFEGGSFTSTDRVPPFRNLRI